MGKICFFFQIKKVTKEGRSLNFLNTLTNEVAKDEMSIIFQIGTKLKIGNNSSCPLNASCAECVQSSSCIYCETQNICIEGSILGPPSGSSKCDGWRWKQCIIAGQTLIIISACSLAFIILVVVIVIACCCRKCRRRRKQKETSVDLYSLEREPFLISEPLDPKKEESRRKRQEIKDKYNIN